MSSMNSKNIDLLLTGGAGFLGSRFVELYHDMFENIYVLDNFSATPRVLSYPNVHYVREDICDPSSFSGLPSRIDICIHLAAAISVAESVSNPAKYRRINVEGSRNVFQWCAAHGCKACVCASTAAVYGKVKEGQLTEEDADGGLSPYAQTKFEMEKVARELFPICEGVETYGERKPGHCPNENNKMRINFIRPFNIYGPRQPCGAHPSFIPSALQSAIQKGTVSVCGDGLQTRDFVFVDDVCHAFYALAVPPETEEDTALSSSSNSSQNNGMSASKFRCPKHLKAYNVGTGHSISITSLANRIAETVKRGSHKNVRVEHIPARPQEAMFSEADIRSISNEIGWVPKVSLEEGLEMTYKWFSEERE